jgi:hypothetical protein
MDLAQVKLRIEAWLADGKDVVIHAVPRAVAGFPMVEIRDAGTLEVVTSAGCFCEESSTPAAADRYPAPAPADGPTGVQAADCQLRASRSMNSASAGGNAREDSSCLETQRAS